MKKLFFFSMFFIFCFVIFAEDKINVKNCFIEANAGISIYSMEEGIVLQIGYNSTNGNYIKIQYSETKLTVTYCNLSRMSVKKGQRVKRGMKLGTVGATGITKGPGVSLLIEFDENGMYLNREDIDILEIIHLFEK